MRTTIDGAGRLVVPKPLRDQLGLEPGTELDVAVRDGRLEIDVPPVEMRLERRGKGLVAVTETPVPALTADEVRRALDRTRG